MVEVIGTFHTTETWAMIYYLHLRKLGHDLDKIDSNTALGQKIMREFGRIPFPRQTPVQAVIGYLSKFNLAGKRVGLELAHHIEDIEAADRMMGIAKQEGGEFDFFKQVRDYVESMGGEVVNQDNRDLYWSLASGKLSPNREMRIHFRRTVHMVNPWTNGPIDFLVTGIAHAEQVKSILGKDAHVTLIAPPVLRRVYATEHQLFRKHVRRAKPRTIEQFRKRLSSARRRTR